MKMAPGQNEALWEGVFVCLIQDHKTMMLSQALTQVESNDFYLILFSTAFACMKSALWLTPLELILFS